MASQARIDANRRNAQRSTGPRTEAGKSRAKLNALKDGSHAKTVNPVLPQEDPIELDGASTVVERPQPAKRRRTRAGHHRGRISRGSSTAPAGIETARLAYRVRKAQLKDQPAAKKEVGELGRRLLYNAGSKTLPTSGTTLGR